MDELFDVALGGHELFQDLERPGEAHGSQAKSTDRLDRRLAGRKHTAQSRIFLLLVGDRWIDVKCESAKERRRSFTVGNARQSVDGLDAVVILRVLVGRCFTEPRDVLVAA